MVVDVHGTAYLALRLGHAEQEIQRAEQPAERHRFVHVQHLFIKRGRKVVATFTKTSRESTDVTTVR